MVLPRTATGRVHAQLPGDRCGRGFVGSRGYRVESDQASRVTIHRAGEPIWIMDIH